MKGHLPAATANSTPTKTALTVPLTPGVLLVISVAAKMIQLNAKHRAMCRHRVTMTAPVTAVKPVVAMTVMVGAILVPVS